MVRSSMVPVLDPVTINTRPVAASAEGATPIKSGINRSAESSARRTAPVGMYLMGPPSSWDAIV
jgi:hypothetical protein